VKSAAGCSRSLCQRRNQIYQLKLNHSLLVRILDMAEVFVPRSVVARFARLVIHTARTLIFFTAYSQTLHAAALLPEVARMTGREPQSLAVACSQKKYICVKKSNRLHSHPDLLRPPAQTAAHESSIGL
jgi:hypothetical protein